MAALMNGGRRRGRSGNGGEHYSEWDSSQQPISERGSSQSMQKEGARASRSAYPAREIPFREPQKEPHPRQNGPVMQGLPINERTVLGSMLTKEKRSPGDPHNYRYYIGSGEASALAPMYNGHNKEIQRPQQSSMGNIAISKARELESPYKVNGYHRPQHDYQGGPIHKDNQIVPERNGYHRSRPVEAVNTYYEEVSAPHGAPPFMEAGRRGIYHNEGSGIKGYYGKDTDRSKLTAPYETKSHLQGEAYLGSNIRDQARAAVPQQSFEGAPPPPLPRHITNETASIGLVSQKRSQNQELDSQFHRHQKQPFKVDRRSHHNANSSSSSNSDRDGIKQQRSNQKGRAARTADDEKQREGGEFPQGSSGKRKKSKSDSRTKREKHDQIEKEDPNSSKSRRRKSRSKRARSEDKHRSGSTSFSTGAVSSAGTSKTKKKKKKKNVEDKRNSDLLLSLAYASEIFDRNETKKEREAEKEENRKSRTPQPQKRRRIGDSSSSTSVMDSEESGSGSSGELPRNHLVPPRKIRSSMTPPVRGKHIRRGINNLERLNQLPVATTSASSSSDSTSDTSNRTTGRHQSSYDSSAQLGQQQLHQLQPRQIGSSDHHLHMVGPGGRRVASSKSLLAQPRQHQQPPIHPDQSLMEHEVMIQQQHQQHGIQRPMMMGSNSSSSNAHYATSASSLSNPSSSYSMTNGSMISHPNGRYFLESGVHPHPYHQQQQQQQSISLGNSSTGTTTSSQGNSINPALATPANIYPRGSPANQQQIHNGPTIHPYHPQQQQQQAPPPPVAPPQQQHHPHHSQIAGRQPGPVPYATTTSSPMHSRTPQQQQQQQHIMVPTMATTIRRPPHHMVAAVAPPRSLPPGLHHLGHGVAPPPHSIPAQHLTAATPARIPVVPVLAQTSARLIGAPIQAVPAVKINRKSGSGSSRGSGKSSKSFPCTFEGCNVAFSTRFSLKRHMKKHTGERPFACPYNCGKSFAEKSTLTRHVRVHTGKRPYVCKFPGCDKSFADRTNIKRHELLHTGKRPYRCCYCLRGFFYPKQVIKHISELHKEKVHVASVVSSATSSRRSGSSGNNSGGSSITTTSTTSSSGSSQAVLAQFEATAATAVATNAAAATTPAVVRSQQQQQQQQQQQLRTDDRRQLMTQLLPPQK